MFCENCGREITADVKYCEYCGNKITTRPQNEKNNKELHTSTAAKVAIGGLIAYVLLAILVLIICVILLIWGLNIL